MHSEYTIDSHDGDFSTFCVTIYKDLIDDCESDDEYRSENNIVGYLKGEILILEDCFFDVGENSYITHHDILFDSFTDNTYNVHELLAEYGENKILDGKPESEEFPFDYISKIYIASDFHIKEKYKHLDLETLLLKEASKYYSTDENSLSFVYIGNNEELLRKVSSIKELPLNEIDKEVAYLYGYTHLQRTSKFDISSELDKLDSAIENETSLKM